MKAALLTPLLCALASPTFAASGESLTSLSLPNAYKTVPEFCRVAATLTPSDDSDIKVEVWLPSQGWNRELPVVGNGEWAGVISYAALAEAMKSGYAVPSTDTGHSDSGGSDALRRSCWNRCSTGGRQALKEAQLFPGDFDSIIAGAPGNRNLMALSIAHALLKDPASHIPPAKFPAIHQAAINACDALDGLKDGLIQDPIRKFVAGGGAVVATEYTSLNNWRNRRRDFGQHGLLGVSARERPGNSEGERFPGTAPVRRQSGGGRVVYIPEVKPAVEKPRGARMTYQYWKLPLNAKEIVDSVRWAGSSVVDVSATNTVAEPMRQGTNVPKVTLLSPDRSGAPALPHQVMDGALDFTVPHLATYDLAVIELNVI
jgi:hypothetical protein